MIYAPSMRKLDLVRGLFPDDVVLRHFSAASRWVEWRSATPVVSSFWDIGVHGCDSFICSGIPQHNSGKTFGIIHKIIRHAFDTNGAMAAIVCKTLKNAKSAGVWALLSRALPLWEKQCYGFKVVEGPKTTGDTKLSYVKIRNRHGTISEIQCHSLEHAQEVEAKFKGANYSFFWLSEIDQFCTDYAFEILCDALRMTPFVPFSQHQIVADCNPPDTGPNNWIHDRFFKFKDRRPEPDETAKAAVARGRIHRILVMIDDNPQLDPDEKDDLVERYRKRKSLYARFIEGKWEMDATDGHFSDVWDETVHVVGRVDCPEDEQEFMVPTAGCVTLLTGWDMGESRNHSFHILEKIVNEVEFTHPDTGKKMRKTIMSFSVLDELVVIRTYISIRQFVEAAMEKIDHWNAYHKKHQNIVLNWRHWSDTSAFQKRSAAESSDAAIAFEASDGRIILDGAPKYRNSRRDRVKLVWQFLYEKRLHVSAQLAVTKSMFVNLKQGGEAEYIKEDDHKHPFDSLSYPMIAEAPVDMFRSAELSVGSKEQANKLSGLVIARI